MVKNKKSPSKSLKKKITNMTKEDMFKSIAIASVLLNVLFLVSIFVLTNASTFDYRVYSASKERYCQNTDGLKQRSEELGSDKAAQEELQINCVGKQFEPFYNEAVQKYRAQENQ